MIKKLLTPANMNVLLAVVVTIGLAFVLWQGWQQRRAAFAGVKSSVPGATPTPTLPTLQLNSTHSRQGGAVTVDPNKIGRVDPFSAPAE